jgi:hypothetical protein
MHRPFFCRRAAPRQKAPPRGAASRRRSEGALSVVGPSQDKKLPHGGQQAEGVARGPFPSSGRPKTKSSPTGGSKPKA